VTLLYPRCSTTALQMFSYNTLDIGRWDTRPDIDQMQDPLKDCRQQHVRLHAIAPCCCGIPQVRRCALSHQTSHRLTDAVLPWHRFLRADYRILVKSAGSPWDRTYLHYFPPGMVFMVVFAFLVPAAYFLVLYFLRHRLQV
jgi:hypothetical protein